MNPVDHGEFLAWLNDYQSIITLILAIAFSGWAFALVWAAKFLAARVEAVGDRIQGIVQAMQVQGNRITKIEGHLETKSDKPFSPYRNGGNKT